ncbi:M1 family metallopeptidase [Nocardioides litoris]|uniref:M1 family metallopeptidase n=1 Tax=Nocardioides litoris TaxID=1926648 RepID=UPI001123D1D1|nr:M1 family metallopeptidase [Nocardioides litoris]
MIRRSAAAALAAVLALTLLPGAPAPAAQVAAGAPSPGAPGVGDPYWPFDGNGGIDVTHYVVRDRYDFATGVLSGTTTLTLRATQALSRFDLDLLLPVRAVSVNGAAARFDKPDGHELRITPARPVARGAVVDVVVSYAGRPAGLRYAGEDTWLADGREVVTMNQPHMAPWWFAANDHPQDKATFDISVTGPATHQVVSNGLPVSRTVSGSLATTRWVARDPMATYLAFFALGRYAVERTERGGLPSIIAVSRDLGPLDQAAALRGLRRTGEITAWLARRVGPYPFESTGGLATSLDPGFALENQTRPTYPGTSPRSALLLVHELGHQWFGDSVTLRRWRDIWLHEGFATFLEHHWTETHGGPSAQTWLRRTWAARQAARGYWRTSLVDPGAGRIFSAPVYERGAMTLQALRHRIGSRAFFRVLRTWARERRLGHGTTGQFRRLAERVAGEQLDGFFRAWLVAPRPPAQTRRNGLR